MTAEAIGDLQVHFLHKAKKYIVAKEAEGINTAESALCYLNSWSNVPGYSVLKYWQKGLAALPSFFSINAKSFIAISRISGYRLFGAKETTAQHTRVIVSWCRKEDFSSNGVYFDRYFKIHASESTNILWFLISVDNFVPEQIDSNVLIFAKEENRTKRDLLFLARTFFSIVINNRLSPRKIIHQSSVSCVYARMVSDALAAALSGREISGIMLPYEAQPLHQTIFQKLKKLHNTITTAGYLHSALPPLMTDLIYRPGAPDVLYVHGYGQIRIMHEFLGWPEETLKFIPSLRFRKNSQQSMAGFIYLPYTFFDATVYIEQFEIFLKGSLAGTLPRLTTRNHPHQGDSEKHLQMIRKLDELLETYNDRFTNNTDKKMSVFLGATAAIVEALERDVHVIHICTDPVFESHSQKIWNDMEVSQISDFTFSYALKEKGQYIYLGDGDHLFTDLMNF